MGPRCCPSGWPGGGQGGEDAEGVPLGFQEASRSGLGGWRAPGEGGHGQGERQEWLGGGGVVRPTSWGRFVVVAAAAVRV